VLLAVDLKLFRLIVQKHQWRQAESRRPSSDVWDS